MTCCWQLQETAETNAAVPETDDNEQQEESRVCDKPQANDNEQAQPVDDCEEQNQIEDGDQDSPQSQDGRQEQEEAKAEESQGQREKNADGSVGDQTTDESKDQRHQGQARDEIHTDLDETQEEKDWEKSALFHRQKDLEEEQRVKQQIKNSRTGGE